MIMQANLAILKGGSICLNCSYDSSGALSDRGLCRECNRLGTIRAYYPVIGPKKVPQPTTALPGSPEKVEVLLQREADGEELWHRDDVCVTDRESRAHPREEYRERTQRQGMRERQVRGKHDPWAVKEQDDDDDDNTYDSWVD